LTVPPAERGRAGFVYADAIAEQDVGLCQAIGAETIVSAPKQHNSREETETITEGETPEDWKSKPAKNRQKDKDARWTKKYDCSYFCYKNHIGVDRRHKFMRRYVMSDASVHDSQKFEDVSRCDQHGFGRVGRQRLSQR
jgi:hypothetical protein